MTYKLKDHVTDEMLVAVGFEIKLPINVLKQEELTPSEVVIKLIKEMK